MARIIMREFNSNRTTYVKRPFICNGRRYTYGELFDWKRLSVSHRRARQLFDAGYIRHKDEESVKPETVTTVAETTIVDEQNENITEEETSVEGERFDDDEEDLDEIKSLKKLREIALDEGAPIKRSIAEQREAIKQHRIGGPNQ